MADLDHHSLFLWNNKTGYPTARPVSPEKKNFLVNRGVLLSGYGDSTSWSLSRENVDLQPCIHTVVPGQFSTMLADWMRVPCVVDALFLELGRSQLRHELQVTLMVEVTAIVIIHPTYNHCYSRLSLSGYGNVTSWSLPRGNVNLQTCIHVLVTVQFSTMHADQFSMRWRRGVCRQYKAEASGIVRNQISSPLM